MENTLKKALAAALLVLLAVISVLFIADKASAPETHKSTQVSIDEKVETVMKLTATSAVASVGISVIAGDMATPIAEKLADFSEYFLLILCVLYSEKYMMSVLGAAVFRFLVPCVCGLFIVGLFWKPDVMRRLGLKLLVAAVAVYLVIPFSIRVSDLIYGVYKSSIDYTITSAEELTEETDELAEAKEDKGLIASIMNKLSETTSTLTDKAADILSRFVETLAVMIVTSCIIPILVLLFFLWLIKQLTGVDMPLPFQGFRERRHGQAKEPKE